MAGRPAGLGIHACYLLPCAACRAGAGGERGPGALLRSRTCAHACVPPQMQPDLHHPTRSLTSFTKGSRASLPLSMHLSFPAREMSSWSARPAWRSVAPDAHAMPVRCMPAGGAGVCQHTEGPAHEVLLVGRQRQRGRGRERERESARRALAVQRAPPRPLHMCACCTHLCVKQATQTSDFSIDLNANIPHAACCLPAIYGQC